MNVKGGIQDIWAITDKPLIEKMKHKIHKNEKDTEENKSTSSDENWDTDSDSSSRGSFTAVPPEFRPNFIQKKSPTLRKDTENKLNPNNTFMKYSQSVQKEFTSKTIQSKSSANRQTDEILPLENEISNTFFIECSEANETTLKTRGSFDFSFPAKTSPSGTKISLQNKFSNYRIAANLNSATVKPKKSLVSSNVQRNDAEKGEADKKITKPQAKISFEVILAENEKLSEIPKIPEILTSINIPSNNNNSSSQNLVKVLPLKESAKKRIPQFEYVKESEDIKLSESPVIEFDFSKVSKNEKMNNINNNNNYKIQNKIKKVPKKKNNLKHIYSQGNKQIVSDKLKVDFLENNTVKWNSTLDLNDTKSTFNDTVSSKIHKGNVSEKSCDKFQWKVIHEEKDNENQCCSEEKIKNFNHNKEKFAEHLAVKDNSCISVENFEYNSNNLMNMDFGKNCSIKAEKYSQKVKFDIMYDNVIKDSTNCEDLLIKSNCVNQVIKEGTNSQDLLLKSNCVESENLATYKEKSKVIECGKEICDFIIGSYIALTTLLSFYNEWKVSRCKLIDQFQKLEKILNDSSKNYQWYHDLPKIVNGVAFVAEHIPNPQVGKAAKIISALSSFVKPFLKSSKTKTIYVDESEITGFLLNDIDASYELYMYGLQCNGQFEETSKLIKEFYSTVATLELLDEHLDAEINTFIQGMLEYKPHHHTFYKKLHKCFQELLQKSSSCDNKFYEPFKLNSSNAVDVIGYLNWRFEFNNMSVKEELNDIHHMIKNDSSTSLKDLKLKINNCIRILENELKSVERCISEGPSFLNEQT